MARLTPKGQLKGSVGPVSYRSFNGNTYLQTKPGRGNVPQTVNSQHAASDFGRASTLAKAIRQALFPIVQDRADNTFYRRFTAQVHAATQKDNPHPKGSRSLIDGDLSLLRAIDCNTNSPFAAHCAISPSVALGADRTLTLSLPEFQPAQTLRTPDRNNAAALCFFVFALDPVTLQQSDAVLFKVEVPNTSTVVLPTNFTTGPLPEHRLIVVASALFAYRNDAFAGPIVRNSGQWHPCEVSAVLRS